MSNDLILVLGVVLGMFGAFAVSLLWADSQTRALSKVAAARESERKNS